VSGSKKPLTAIIKNIELEVHEAVTVGYTSDAAISCEW
jgi:hypothetical protein